MLRVMSITVAPVINKKLPAIGWWRVALGCYLVNILRMMWSISKPISIDLRISSQICRRVSRLVFRRFLEANFVVSYTAEHRLNLNGCYCYAYSLQTFKHLFNHYQA